MQNKRWILGLVILVVAIAAISIWGFNKSDNKQTASPQVSGENTDEVNYFDENAKVMYFYSDYCSWCLKEKEVLTKLGNEGYKVKSMNVGENQNYWQDYNISGTPTFIAENGDRFEGFHDYDKLKPWLDSHK